MNALTGELEKQSTIGRVLIIDDASTIRRYHRMIVEDAGFEADEAFNGLEAMEAALRETYDIFIVDVNMPEMNGYKFVSEARRTPELSSIPAVMVSTEAEKSDSDQAYAAGATYYLVKPAMPDKLKDCLSLLVAGGTK